MACQASGATAGAGAPARRLVLLRLRLVVSAAAALVIAGVNAFAAGGALRARPALAALTWLCP